MGIMWLFVIAFAITFGVVYTLMRLVCYLKVKYCQAEHALCKLLEKVECMECKEACVNHGKLIVRALLISTLVAALTTTMVCALR